MRSKRLLSFLTSLDKSLVRTTHNMRTISKQKKLSNLFAELKCWITPELRERIVPVIKFISVSAGRVIMRQARCDLLVLFENDCKSILQPYMQKIWNDKKRAIKALDYFDFLSDDQLLNACKICTLKEYKPLDTIYSQDRGSLTNVHFVLSGECVILQCLNMKVTIKNGRKKRHLLNVSEDSSLSTLGDAFPTKKAGSPQPMIAAARSTDKYDNNKTQGGPPPAYSDSSAEIGKTEALESHFIDVGSITFGGIFGLGEEMSQRTIMARSTVQCLLFPRFVLLDKDLNPENIWNRRLFDLNCIIPSREALFDHYLQTLKWRKFKLDYITHNIISTSSDIAKADDIPILCRIEENAESD